MTRYRAILAYEGSAYYGFQRQAETSGQPTIQATVERVLGKLSGSPVRISGAGRTDTGVHATGNVIAFDLDWRHGTEALLRALNATLPQDIAIQTLDEATPTFHPRFDATSRVYEYRVYESKERNPVYGRTAWHIRGSLNLSEMNVAAATLLGIHNFATFGNPTQGESTTRYVFTSRWAAETLAGENVHMSARFLTYTVEANGFLHHMVRTLTGALVEVGLGHWSVAHFVTLLEAKDRGLGRPMSPPHGLTLIRVTYLEPTTQIEQRENAPLTGENE